MDKFIEKLEEILEWGGTKKDITCLVLSGIGLIISIFDLIPLPFDAAWIAILLCGLPIIMEAIIGLITAFDIKADVLVSLALIASVLIGEDFAAGEVAFIMQLGALLEDLTVSKAREGIEKLVHLTPQTARVLTGIGEKIIPAEQVKIGDRIRVLPGETVPVDGVILTGQTSINYQGGNDSGCFLSLCTGTCHTDSDYGCNRKCDKTRIPCAGRRCAGTSFRTSIGESDCALL